MKKLAYLVLLLTACSQPKNPEFALFNTIANGVKATCTEQCSIVTAREDFTVFRLSGESEMSILNVEDLEGGKNPIRRINTFDSKIVNTITGNILRITAYDGTPENQVEFIVVFGKQ
jgi:hypothetical protein